MNDLPDWYDFTDPDIILNNPFSDLTGPNGPELWDGILKNLNNEGAVIAGGAVRDYLLGVEPKDIDIFVPTSTLVPPPTFDSLFPDLRAEEYEAMDTIDIVMRGEIAGFTCDLIGADFDDPQQLVETFDFGLSRCFYCPERGMVASTDFIEDADAKTVTLLIDDRRERALRRFERFNERMGGGWTLVEKPL